MARKPAAGNVELPDHPPGDQSPPEGGGDQQPQGNGEQGDQPAPPPEPPAPPKETKAAAFVRLASNRVSNVLYHVANVGKLSGASYESTPEQRQRMFAAIRKAVDDAEARFQPKPAAGKPTFTL
jgi:hypothetical protein